MRRALAVAAVVAGALAAGCDRDEPQVPGTTAPAGATSTGASGASTWTQAGGGPERRATTAEPGPQALPGIAWTNPVAREILSEPVFGVAGGRPAVLIGSGADALAFDLDTGKTIWSHETASSINASPAIVGDSAWVLVMDSLLLQLSARDGSLVKEHELDFTLEASPLLTGGRLVFEETSLSSQVTQNRLHAWDPVAGTESWHADFERGAGRGPSSDGRRVFVAAYDAVHAFALASGQLEWTKPFGATAARVYAPVVAPSSVIVVHGTQAGSTVEALDPATGKPSWTRAFPSRTSAAPAVTDSEVLLPLMDSKVHRLALADGAELGVLDPGRRSDVRPVVTPTRIFVGVGQTVIAYDRATLQEAWRIELESLEVSSAGIAQMAVLGRRLVVARLDGNLHALEAPGE